MIADRIAGCLLGGAIGDAMGAGIEFMSLATIRRDFGPAGISDYAPGYGSAGTITDDTQMSLFTAEGIIRASVRLRTTGVCHTPSVVRHAYLRWLFTQDPNIPLDPDLYGADLQDVGWLVGVEGLHRWRAPGNTCLSALWEGGDGTIGQPINSSKGCGGVMRAAPAGFIAAGANERFDLGCDVAALTHGHPDGYLPAGFLAVAVGALVDGADLDAALDDAEGALRSADRSESTLAAVHAGRALGRQGLPTPEEVETLGGGWVGDEALAIGVACAVAATDFRSGVLAAVNHTGDSDSTGSIAGNLLGAHGGVSVLPAEWLDRLELRDVITQVAADAAQELRGAFPPEERRVSTAEWLSRYPGV